MSDTITQVLQAKHPEDLFGALDGDQESRLDAVKAAFRRLAIGCHPDSHPGPRAGDAFNQLHELRDAALEAIRAGTYGRRHGSPTAIVVRSRKRSYTITGAPRSLDLADLFPAHFDDPPRAALLKVAASPADNDLLAAEAATLRRLRAPDRPEAAGFLPMLPDLIDAFDLIQAGVTRRVNAFAGDHGFFSLEQVRSAYPAGLDPKHVAWMFRQLLLVLGYVHTRGVIHGSVLPHHVLIHPEHDLLLVEFTAAVRDPQATGAHIPVMSTGYADFYSQEVPAKQTPSPATDIAMAARCMRYLLDGAHTHPRLGGFLASCELPSPARRPQDAWQTRDEFTRLIEGLWGPRRRIPFTIPN